MLLFSNLTDELLSIQLFAGRQKSSAFLDSDPEIVRQVLKGLCVWNFRCHIIFPEWEVKAIHGRILEVENRTTASRASTTGQRASWFESGTPGSGSTFPLARMRPVSQSQKGVQKFKRHINGPCATTVLRHADVVDLEN